VESSLAIIEVGEAPDAGRLRRAIAPAGRIDEEQAQE
jgi:hypothetical protein